MTTDENEVLAANQAFYEAFSRGDYVAVDALWARRAPIACIHPGWDVIRGREEVMASFRSILRAPHPPPIRCLRATATVLGEVAFVICGESLDDSSLVATNVFVREDGAWRLVHHQAGPVNARAEARAKPKPPAPGLLN